jgi:hypothetical protein
MNVFYIGPENPLSISVPGANSKDIVATISGAGGKLKQVGDGEYLVTVTQQGSCQISVKAKVGGKEMDMGTMKFRTKVMPKPVAKVGKFTGGRVSKEELKMQPGLRVELEDFLFDGIRYTPVGYKFQVLRGTEAMTPLTATSGQFTAEMKAQIEKLRRGDRVVISEIRAKGIDGVRPTSNEYLMFTIK